jgi:mycothiol synthase
MSVPHYILRNYRPGDFNSYVQLHVEAERLDRAGHCTSPRVLREALGRPNYSPENDLFVAEREGKVIGYVNVTPELGIGRVVLSCLVHPEHRRKGLATRLYYDAVRRASSLGARVVQGSIAEGNVAARNLLSRLGFRFARRFLELRLELSEVQGLDAGDIACACRPLRRGDEAKLTEIQNRSFAGTWGYHPNTVEEIAYRVSLSDCCPEGIILVYEGDQPVGYCWATIDAEGNTAAGTRKGRIHMLGVVPDYRGKGLGRHALLAGLSYLGGRGIEVAEVTVDSENKGACVLYVSVGFKIWSTTAWHEKAVD